MNKNVLCGLLWFLFYLILILCCSIYKDTIGLILSSIGCLLSGLHIIYNYKDTQ